MPVVNCPIDIPEGWESVEYRVGKHGETCLINGDPCRICDDSTGYPVLIIRKTKDTAPDPGEGYRRAEGEDWKDERCEIWCGEDWVPRDNPGDRFVKGWHYRIPVDPAPKHPPVPEGWRLIDKEKDYPKRADDKFWNRTSGTWAAVAYDLEFEPTDTYIRRARPEIKVGDWVKLNWELSRFHGAAGQVRAIDDPGQVLVEMDSSDGASVFVDRGRLIKQSRTIEPYTIDQCIAEAAKRGRHVQLGSKSTLIESIHIAGVTLSCPSIGFVSYVEAAKSLTWSGGEAFGIERWEDAE